jgi:hypothetical protein
VTTANAAHEALSRVLIKEVCQSVERSVAPDAEDPVLRWLMPLGLNRWDINRVVADIVFGDNWEQRGEP